MCTARFGSVFLACVLLIGASGCASITGTTNQSVSVQTLEPAGKELPGAVCELSNSKGKWFVTTPGSTMITRSNDDMQVICNKEGFDPGRAAVVSATKGSMFGNIIFGGGVGAIIDHNSGAAYEYPTFFRILMGAMTRIEPPSEGDPAAETASAPPAPPNSTGAMPATAQPVSTSTGAQPSSGTLVLSGTVEERLKELKRLHEAGLISNEVYAEQQRQTMQMSR